MLSVNFLAFDLSELAAHQVEQDHRFGPVYFVCGGACPITKPLSLSSAVLLAGLHHSNKPAYSVYFLSVNLTELPEAA
jgi:hypothetical protein